LWVTAAAIFAVPAAANAVASTTQQAKDEEAALRGKLTEATDSFLKPKGGISAERLAEIEQQLAPLIADAERRSVSRKAPQAMLDLLSAAEFGAARVRPVWDGLPIPAQREVLRLLFDDIFVGQGWGGGDHGVQRGLDVRVVHVADRGSGACIASMRPLR
jgi:hypothetical protein